MMKSDVQCVDCGVGYRRIELISKRGKEGRYRCLVCGRVLETFDGKHQQHGPHPVARTTIPARSPL
jgi:uncharacterized Zn finger protein